MYGVPIHVNASSRNETLGTSSHGSFSNLRHFLQGGCTIFNAIVHKFNFYLMHSHIIIRERGSVLYLGMAKEISKYHNI